MFTYVKESNVYWFSINGANGSLAEYNLIGVLMGLAVYNGEILDIHFPPCVYKKLSVVDNECESKRDNIGVLSTLSLYDLSLVMPSLASGLQQLLDYEGDVREDFMLKFVASYTEFDVVHTVPLKDDGENIDLTNENKHEYVNLYIDFLLNKSIYNQFKAFYHGFHNVCHSNAMIVSSNLSPSATLGPYLI